MTKVSLPGYGALVKQAFKLQSDENLLHRSFTLVLDIEYESKPVTFKSRFAVIAIVQSIVYRMSHMVEVAGQSLPPPDGGLQVVLQFAQPSVIQLVRVNWLSYDAATKSHSVGVELPPEYKLNTCKLVEFHMAAPSVL